MITEIISIDGPSGSGKTSIGKLLASELNCQFISSGAIYRTITKGIIDLHSTEKFFKDMKSFDEIYDAFLVKQFEVKVLKLNETESLIEYRDIKSSAKYEQLSSTKDLYTKEITKFTSKISKVGGIRDSVSIFLREFVIGDSLNVVEGRDIGSVVFKNAKLKIYIDSPLELRAKRRLNQSSNEEGLSEMIKRDKEDISRKNSPLIIPDGSLILVNEKQSIEDLVKIIKSEYESLELS